MNVRSLFTGTDQVRIRMPSGSLISTKSDEVSSVSLTVPRIVTGSPRAKVSPFNVAVRSSSDCTCCCALMIVKLEAKRIIAMTTVSPVVITGDTNNGEDLPITLRTRESRFQSKIRLWIDYSVKKQNKVTC